MPGQPGKFAFNFPDMSIGEYELKLRNMAYIEHVQLPPEGLSNFVMAVPPPINVTVRVEDVETGQDIPSVTEVVWTPNRPDGSLRLGGVPVERDAITGSFQLRITDCELTLWAKAPDYSQEMRSFRPTSGQVAVLRLRPRLSVELELRDGGVAIPWPKGDHTWVESASKGEEWCPNGKRDGIRWFMVNHPGKYSLEIPKIDGYQAHAPVEFTVEKGARTSIVVDLTPE